MLLELNVCVTLTKCVKSLVSLLDFLVAQLISVPPFCFFFKISASFFLHLKTKNFCRHYFAITSASLCRTNTKSQVNIKQKKSFQNSYRAISHIHIFTKQLTNLLAYSINFQKACKDQSHILPTVPPFVRKQPETSTLQFLLVHMLFFL